MLLLLLTGSLCAQTSVRILPPAEPRFREGAPAVIHIQPFPASDVPARLSRFGFIDVIVSGWKDLPEALQRVKYTDGALIDEIGVIAWSKIDVIPPGFARWIAGEAGALPRDLRQLAVIIWAPETSANAPSRYAAIQQRGVRWIRLNPSAHYIAEVSGRNAAILVDNPPNARFDNHFKLPALAPAPSNGGPSDALGIAAAALELADRTHRKDW